MAENEMKSNQSDASSRADENKILLFLGLATKAGKTASGYDAVSQATRSGSAFLVLCAEDASEATARKIADVCRQEAVPIRRFSTREMLGRFLEKTIEQSPAFWIKALPAAYYKCWAKMYIRTIIS